MSVTNTLQRSINFASIYTRLNPLVSVGGIANEPALTIGDYVRQMLLGPPFSWRWNRVQTAFLATIGVQDYELTNWAAGLPVTIGEVYVDPNGNQQQVTVTGVTGVTAPVWSTSQNGFTVDNTATWQNKGAVGLKTPLLPFGWLEKAVAVDGSGNPHELTIQLNIAQNPVNNQPFVIAPVVDNNNGKVTFRMQPPPEQAYTVYLIYQQSAPSFVALSDTWAPIPDYFSYLYNQGVLAKTYEYLADERYSAATQMFVKFLVAANEGLSESQVNIFLAERMNVLRQGQDVSGTAQSARAGRSLG